MTCARAGRANASSGAAATLAAFDGSDRHHYFQGMNDRPAWWSSPAGHFLWSPASAGQRSRRRHHQVPVHQHRRNRNLLPLRPTRTDGLGPPMAPSPAGFHRPAAAVLLHRARFPVVQHYFLGKGVAYRVGEQVGIRLLDTVKILHTFLASMFGCSVRIDQNGHQIKGKSSAVDPWRRFQSGRLLLAQK
jgi:hypothetical protein